MDAAILECLATLSTVCTRELNFDMGTNYYTMMGHILGQHGRLLLLLFCVRIYQAVSVPTCSFTSIDCVNKYSFEVNGN